MSREVEPDWLNKTEVIPCPVDNAQDDLSSITSEMRAAFDERDKILASLSWRMTNPIRRGADLLRGKNAEPSRLRFGIVTPVFDGCLSSLELLLSNLLSQTHTNWTWIISSNGYSRRMSDFANRKRKLFSHGRQITYHFSENEPTSDYDSLLANIGKRRDSCINRIDADVIFTIDADARLLDRWMFSTIESEIERTSAKICVYRILNENSPSKLLPIFPLTFGTIDALNFCVDAKIAKQVRYPTTVAPSLFGNEFRYFHRAYQACNREYLFIDRIFAEWNGNRHYENLLKLKAREGESKAKTSSATGNKPN